MPFVQKLPEWNKPGTEPPASLKNAGWAATQKPPADYFNWLQYTAYMALKELQEKAQHKDDSMPIQDASITQKGITQLSSAVTSTAEDRAATPNAVKKVNDALNTHSNEKASLSAYGHAKLSSATNSTAEDLAATPKAVKAAYDRAEQAFTQANDGKTAVASAVTAKGVSASPADTFATLAAKIGQINTGKKFATGSNVVPSSSSKQYVNAKGGNTDLQTLTVTGLTFKPSVIVAYWSNGAYLTLYANPGDISSKNRIYVGTARSGTYGQDFQIEDVSPVLITNTSFSIPILSPGATVNWIAIE